jgi:glutamyl-tRNA reductase
MRLIVVGLNHRTAPVQLREKFAYQPDEIPAALREMRAQGVREALILSTCNRVEWAAALDDAAAPEPFIQSLLERPGVTLEELQPHLYLLEGQAAIKHLFRVAASLDSMIVGEPQILGQLKVAFAQAREHGAIGNVLDTIVTRAFNVAKRIRTETEIGQNGVSVGYAAVELAREIFGSLQKKRVLIVGAGKMSEGAAKHLMRAGAVEIFLTNRTPERAQELAKLFSGEVIRYEVFPQRLSDVDIVITSSAAPGYVITREMVRRAIETRKSQPVFLIDIAVPRNIDPAVQELEHAFLYDIDDLQRLATSNLRARESVAQRAENIVAEEVARLEAKLRERDVAPTIVSLREQLELIRREEVLRHRAKLGPLTVEQEEALDALTRGIVNKIAHGPISEMRRQAGQVSTPGEEPQEAELVSAVRRMFRLGGRS